MHNLHIVLNDFNHASRVLKEADGLMDAGKMVEVSVAALHGPGLEISEVCGKGIRVHRFGLKTRGLNKSLPAQSIKYLEYCCRVFVHYRKHDIGAVNIHSLGLLPLGVFLKWAYGAKLIYDTHELETERNGVTGLRKRLGKFLERRLIKYADMTLVVSESIADWYAREYRMARPTVVLNAPKTRPPKNNDHFRQELGIRADQTILLYQGGLMAGRGVHLIVDAFRQRHDDRVVAVFMGYGPLEADIKAAAAAHDNIRFYPAVPPDVVLEYTASADLGIHLIQNTCLNHYYCMPNKLFEYAMVSLPVLVSNMKDMAALVSANNMGAVIDDFTVAGINKAIDEFLAGDVETMRANAYRVACENAWEVQEQKMLAAYRQMLAGQVAA